MTDRPGPAPAPGDPGANPRAAPGPWLRLLWRGQRPLAVALWRDALLFGTLANLAATLAALAAISSGAPDLVGLALFFLPTPYYILATVGVWRSADRYPGRAFWALAAQTLVCIWLGLVLLV